MQKYSLVFEKVLFGLFILLLLFIPLYPKFPLFNIKETFVAIRIEDILIVLTYIVWFYYLYISKQIKHILQDKINQIILLFFFIGLVSLFSAVFLTQTVSLKLGVFHYLRRVEFITLLPFAYFVIKTRKQVQLSLIILSLVTFLVNIYAFGQKYLAWPVVSTTNSEFSKGTLLHLTPGARVSSTFAGHYDLAVFLVMAIVLISSLFFNYQKILVKTWLAFLSIISFVVLVMTAARLSFVAVILGIMASLVLTGKKIFIILILIISAAALIYPSQLRDRMVSTVTVNLLGDKGESYSAEFKDQEVRSRLNIPTLPGKNWDEIAKEASLSASSSGTRNYVDIVPGEPIDATDLGVYRSFGIRLQQEWPRAIRGFVKNPLLGTGYSSLGLATDNDFLRMLGEVGILGAGAFVLVFIEIIRRIWSIFHSSDRLSKYFSAGTLAMVFAFLINATFIDVFESSKIASLFWMIVGVNLAMEKFK